ncbi:hypothetical protein PSPO01_03342 [Paraphaeosphaeria sporulosa]
MSSPGYYPAYCGLGVGRNPFASGSDRRRTQQLKRSDLRLQLRRTCRMTKTLADALQAADLTMAMRSFEYGKVRSVGLHRFPIWDIPFAQLIAFPIERLENANLPPKLLCMSVAICEEHLLGLPLAMFSTPRLVFRLRYGRLFGVDGFHRIWVQAPAKCCHKYMPDARRLWRPRHLGCHEVEQAEAVVLI